MSHTKYGIWVLAETRNGKITAATLELLGEAVRLGAASGDRVTAVVWGKDCARYATELNSGGANRIITIDDARFDDFLDELQAETLRCLIGKYRPEILLLQASPVGRALAPRVAALCHVGLTADCTRLEIDPDSGALLQTRPAFGGSLMATIRSNGAFPQMATVRPGVMRGLETANTSPAQIVEESAPRDRWSELKIVLEHLKSNADGHSFENVPVIVAGGRGLGREGFALLEEFARLSGAAVGASRAAIDANWISYPHQIGQTGRTVQPKLYIAFGISGQIQHLVGMQTAGFIIAVNRDPEAPLMKMADIAVTGDAAEILQTLIQQLKQVNK